MSFDHAQRLWPLLFAVAAIIALRLLLSGRRSVDAGSFELWQRLLNEEGLRRQRRRLNPSLVLEILTLAIVALAALGPRWLGDEARRTRILVDDSAAARALPLLEARKAQLAEMQGELVFVRQARPDSGLDDDGFGPGPIDWRAWIEAQPAGASISILSPRPWDGALAAGVSVHPLRASIDNRGWVAAERRSMGGEERLFALAIGRPSSEIRIRVAGREETLGLDAEGRARLDRPSPRPDETLRLEILGGDDFDLDDVIELPPLQAPSSRRALVTAGPAFDAVADALAAAHWDISRGDEGECALSVGYGIREGPGTQLCFAPPQALSSSPFKADELIGDLRPAPGRFADLPFGALKLRARALELRPDEALLLIDSEIVAGRRRNRVFFGFAPDEAGLAEREIFPLIIASLAEELAARPSYPSMLALGEELGGSDPAPRIERAVDGDWEEIGPAMSAGTWTWRAGAPGAYRVDGQPLWVGLLDEGASRFRAVAIRAQPGPSRAKIAGGTPWARWALAAALIPLTMLLAARQRRRDLL